MKIEIFGGTISQKKKVESIIRFSMATLISTRLFNRLEITVHLTKNLKKSGIFADCIWEDSNYRPREFVIRADSTLRLRTLLESVAHECVHIKQWAREEMKSYVHSTSVCKFLGKIYNNTTLEYWDRPWEIEAHGRETGLFIRWAEENGYAMCDWAHRVD